VRTEELPDEMRERIVAPLGRVYARLRLPPRATRSLAHDLRGLPLNDPGIDAAIDAGIEWLGRAQDKSATADGGVAKNYSLIAGWSSSYPETTGYIIPTLLTWAKISNDRNYVERAKRMLDWLVSIQFADGAFQAGSVGAKNLAPVTFNTGQILIGLASGVVEFGEAYRAPMREAADWLVATQAADGSWPHHQSPMVARPGEKAYDTHIAWGLFEAAKLEPGAPYGDAGLKSVRRAIVLQTPNGWFDKCSIKDPATPATHTLGYALRGILEGYAFSKDAGLLAAARSAADGMLGALHRDGFLPGRLDRHWRAAAAWSCLTGTVQNATNWMLMWQHTGDPKYLEGAYVANRYVRRSLSMDGDPDVRGAVKGSFPINGAYDPWEYPNWATKFMIDSCMLEREIRRFAVTPVATIRCQG
jgi:hypothetical protein